MELTPANAARRARARVEARTGLAIHALARLTVDLGLAVASGVDLTRSRGRPRAGAAAEVPA